MTMQHPSFAVVVALLLLAGCGPDDPDIPPPPPTKVEVAANTHALLVGCTEYPMLREEYGEDYHDSGLLLLGPENDTKLMQRVLHDYLGVPQENIRVLAGWPDEEARRPTRANILREFDRLIETVPRGANVLFLFAGHGSQQPDDDGDEDDDRDEIFMPADTGLWDETTRRVENAIGDDEIRVRLQALRKAGASVLAIFDCCHSGTLMRGAPPGPTARSGDEEPVRRREVGPRVLKVPEMETRSRTRGTGGTPPPDTVLSHVREPSPRIAAIYAAHSWELATERKLPRSKNAPGREDHGLCTYYVALALQRHGGALTVAEILSQVRAAYRALPCEDAMPLAEGDLSMQLLPGALPAGERLLLMREAGEVVVEAGRLRGLTSGSVLEVFRLDGFGKPEGRLGRIRVAEVVALRARCEAMPGDVSLASIPENAVARLVELGKGQRPLRVAAVDGQGGVLAPDRLARIRRDAGLDEAADLDLVWVQGGAAAWRLYVVDGETPDEARFALQCMRADFEPLVVGLGGLRAALLRVQRAEHLRGLAADPGLSTLPEGLAVSIAFEAPDGSTRVPWSPGVAVTPGSVVVLEIQNDTNRTIDLAIRELDGMQRESHVWPMEGPSHRLHPGDTSPPLVQRMVTDGGLGLESYVLVAAVRAQGDLPMDVSGLTVTTTDEPPEGGRDPGDTSPDGVMGGAPPKHPVAVQEFRWRTAWERIAVPSPLLEGLVALDPPVPTPAYASPIDGAPTWGWARVIPGERGAGDVLLLRARDAAGEPGGFGIFVDADGDVGLDGLELRAAAEGAASRSLPFDTAIVVSGNARWACYPLHEGDRSLGRVIVGEPMTDRAIRSHVLLPSGRWVARPASGSWLSTALLPWEDPEGVRTDPVLLAWRMFCPPK